MAINFLRRLRNNLTGFNGISARFDILQNKLAELDGISAKFDSLQSDLSTLNGVTAKFDILQSKLDAIASSLSDADASVKRLENVIATAQESNIRYQSKLATDEATRSCVVCIANSLDEFDNVLRSGDSSTTKKPETETFTPNKSIAELIEPEDISIVMPIYNHQDTLAEALESVLMQEMPYTSVIYCINDASTDKCADILDEYTKKYPEKIKVYTNPSNLGTGKRSIYKQKPPVLGRYWCILEGDDYWSVTDKLARQISFLDSNPEFIGCSGNTVMKNEITGEETIIQPHRNEWNLLDLILLKNKYSFYVHTSSIIWRNIYKDQGFFLPPAFKEESAYGDVLLMHLMLGTGGKIQNIPEVLSCYRVTGRGIWTSKSPGEQAEFNERLIKNITRFTPHKYKVLSRYHEIKDLIPTPVNE